MQTDPGHTAPTPQLGRYEIDASGSTITFRTGHLFGLAPVRGTFAVLTGTVNIVMPLAESGVYAQIETRASVPGMGSGTAASGRRGSSMTAGGQR